MFSETAGRNTLANGTTRSGWMGETRLTGPFFDQAFNVTMVKAKFDDSGLLVPYVPDLVLRSETAITRELPWKIGSHAFHGGLSSGISYVGRRALPYGERSDTIFTIDAAATLRWAGYKVALSTQNLLNRQYRLGEFNYVSDFRSQPFPTLVAARHFTAGAPRTIFLTLSINFPEVGG